jgi:DNA-binding beta-propeller fold protein YncE
MIRRSSNSNSGIVFVRRINEPALLVMTLLSVGILIAPMGYAQEFSPLTKWGKYGTSNGSFNQPHGIAADGSHFYIADTGNNRIQVFSSNGTFITEWGKYGTSNGSFNQPHGIAVIPQSGNILVSDTENNRIQVFSSNGTFITDWGKHGTGKGRFKSPMDIAVTPQSGNVYVADTGNNRIQVFSSNGTFITEWGKYGTGDNNFRSPTYIAVIPQLSGNSTVVVSDTGNNRIQSFSYKG